jgi:hypothetical protein
LSKHLAQVRRIGRLGLETPLLVPSFSSRGFPDVGEIINALRVDISSLCLVSAFDLAQGYAPEDFETLADVIIIDSGMYEANAAAVVVDAYLPAATHLDWTREAYRTVIANASSRMNLTNAVVVSFDTYAPLAEQVEAARSDFSYVPAAARDFLIKPEVAGQTHKWWRLTQEQLADFDILGVTERELGSSTIERCRTLLGLRTALTEAGLATPIHVFGSITPAAVSAYFLCGADIFDGLNWLRVGLEGAGACAPSEFAITQELWGEDDNTSLLYFWRRNLRTLERTQAALRRFASQDDHNALCAALPFAETCLQLADTIIHKEVNGL